MHERSVIPFPTQESESSALSPHSFEAGGQSMTVKHTHPDATDEERLEQLRAIKRLCAQILQPDEQRKKAG